MLKLLSKIPKDVYLACSGGMDSMVVLDFLSRTRNVVPVYFNHGTEHGTEAEAFLQKECGWRDLDLIIFRIETERPKQLSKEEHWRNERYKAFQSLDRQIITAHHLNDVMEWWIFTSLHGEPKTIPYQNGNVIRPFLISSKKEIQDWAERKEVKYIEDPSNQDTSYMRNLIRCNILPEALKVNPGLEKVIRKKILVP